MGHQASRYGHLGTHPAWLSQPLYIKNHHVTQPQDAGGHNFRPLFIPLLLIARLLFSFTPHLHCPHHVHTNNQYSLKTASNLRGPCHPVFTTSLV